MLQDVKTDVIKTFLKCVREYKLPAILTLVLIIGEVAIEVLIPFYTADLVNDIKASVPMAEVVRLGLILVAMALLSLACGGGAGFYGARASAGFAKNVRHDAFARIQLFSFENIDRFSTASLVTRLTTDITNVQMAFMMAIRIAVRAPLMLVFSIVMAWRMGGRLALTFVVVIPVLVAGLLLIARKVMPAFRAVFHKYDRLNESVEENVRGMRVVKGFAREGYEKRKFAAASDDIRKDFTYAERLVALNSPLMSLCMYFNMVFILLVGSKLIISGQGQFIDVGQISAINPVCEVKDGSIDFQDVAFRYSREAQNDALYDIDLHIDSGMTVGILGGTGSSKTTLIQLIPRLYDVSAGSVKVGGVDVRDYDLETLRNAVSVVLQKNQLFSGTVRDNLRWGNPAATDEEIAEACRLAQADEFITSHPDGYDRWIEQGGSNVSGGQRQRLCIARALLKKPKILILDDSTSAVDTRTDALIRAGFRSYIPETTKIIIAQRVASVQDADMILVMDNGRIAAAGTHEELLASSPIYREVYEQQTKGGDSDE